MLETFNSLLTEFIAIQSIANDKSSNESAINFISSILKPLGFEISIEGNSPYHQPVIVAKYKSPTSKKKVVLYGHYDVERIKEDENWHTPPFELIEKTGRYYCRGIADNKGALIARLLAIKEMAELKVELPNILWIIQGEEEIEGQTPFEVIPKHFKEFNATFYLEETGMYKDGKPVIFYLPKTEVKPDFLDSLNETIYAGMASFENRSLNKFSKCPFLHSIPEQGIYLGFGPNDALCNVHKENESMDKRLLIEHKSIFKQFLIWVNKANISYI